MSDLDRPPPRARARFLRARLTAHSWLRIQVASGVVFALFVLVHLAHQLTVLWPGAYDPSGALLRRAYQAPPLEVGLILVPLVLHVAAGVALARSRAGGSARRAPDAASRWQRRTGWALALIVPMHAAAARGPSLLWGIYPEQAGVAFALWWMPLFFYPYYLVLGLAAAYHAAYGLRRAALVFGVRAPRVSSRAALAALGLAALALALVVLAFDGRLYPTGDPTDNDYARLYERYLGVDLSVSSRSP